MLEVEAGCDASSLTTPGGDPEYREDGEGLSDADQLYISDSQGNGMA